MMRGDRDPSLFPPPDVAVPDGAPPPVAPLTAPPPRPYTWSACSGLAKKAPTQGGRRRPAMKLELDEVGGEHAGEDGKPGAGG